MRLQSTIVKAARKREFLWQRARDTLHDVGRLRETIDHAEGYFSLIPALYSS